MDFTWYGLLVVSVLIGLYIVYMIRQKCFFLIQQFLQKNNTKEAQKIRNMLHETHNHIDNKEYNKANKKVEEIMTFYQENIKKYNKTDEYESLLNLSKKAYEVSNVFKNLEEWENTLQDKPSKAIKHYKKVLQLIESEQHLAARITKTLIQQLEHSRK